MTTKVIIYTQYFENYNIGPDGINTYGDCKPYWKAKGGHEFEIELDTDLLMYTDAKSILAEIVAAQSTLMERFEYVDHELQFSAPTKLDASLYEAIAQREAEKCLA